MGFIKTINKGKGRFRVSDLVRDSFRAFTRSGAARILVAFMQQGLEYCIGVAIIEYVSSNAVK